MLPVSHLSPPIYEQHHIKYGEHGPERYLRIATVMASGDVAQGQITSGFSPWD